MNRNWNGFRRIYSGWESSSGWWDIMCVREREKESGFFKVEFIAGFFLLLYNGAWCVCVCGFGITQSDKYNKQLHRPGLAFVRAFEFFSPTFITIFAIVVLPSLALHSFWITAAALNIVIVGER